MKTFIINSISFFLLSLILNQFGPSVIEIRSYFEVSIYLSFIYAFIHTASVLGGHKVKTVSEIPLKRFLLSTSGLFLILTIGLLSLEQFYQISFENDFLVKASLTFSILLCFTTSLIELDKGQVKYKVEKKKIIFALVMLLAVGMTLALVEFNKFTTFQNLIFIMVMFSVVLFKGKRRIKRLEDYKIDQMLKYNLVLIVILSGFIFAVVNILNLHYMKLLENLVIPLLLSVVFVNITYREGTNLE